MNIFGTAFRVSIFGESHGKIIGTTIDGVPAGIALTESYFEEDLGRRRKKSQATTARNEEDVPHIVSGVMNGHTTGAPVTILFENNDARSADYENFRSIPRPGHSDFTADKKFSSFNDIRGGGQFSGRMTLGIVAAGVIAKKIIGGITVKAEVTEIAGEKDENKWEAILSSAVEKEDSVGGIISCRCENIPAGLGEPFFNSLESMISHIVFSIPGIRGIEFGDGFSAAAMYGSEHNDPFIDKEGHTAKNGAGGINGGISNGNPIIFRVAVKPTSSIGCTQKTFNFETGEMDELRIGGRHDACIALRCPPIIESAAAIVLADALLSQHSI